MAYCYCQPLCLVRSTKTGTQESFSWVTKKSPKCEWVSCNSHKPSHQQQENRKISTQPCLTFLQAHLLCAQKPHQLFAMEDLGESASKYPTLMGALHGKVLRALNSTSLRYSAQLPFKMCWVSVVRARMALYVHGPLCGEKSSTSLRGLVGFLIVNNAPFYKCLCTECSYAFYTFY